MQNDDETYQKKVTFAYKFWISFEVRNTQSDRSRRFNTTLFLTRRPKDDNDIFAIEQMLKDKILKSKVDFPLNEKNIKITILSWPHYISKMDASKIPSAPPVQPQPAAAPPKPKRPPLVVIKGGKD
jgi:hypothetical protein